MKLNSHELVLVLMLLWQQRFWLMWKNSRCRRTEVCGRVTFKGWGSSWWSCLNQFISFTTIYFKYLHWVFLISIFICSEPLTRGLLWFSFFIVSSDSCLQDLKHLSVQSVASAAVMTLIEFSCAGEELKLYIQPPELWAGFAQTEMLVWCDSVNGLNPAAPAEEIPHISTLLWLLFSHIVIGLSLAVLWSKVNQSSRSALPPLNPSEFRVI